MEKKLARLLQLILVTFIIFIILDDTSELRTLEVRFLNDPVKSKLFEEPESDSEHKQEYEQEPAPRKRIPQPNKKAAKKTIDDEASSERKKKKKKNPELVSTVMFTSFSNSLDCCRQDIIVEGCCCFWAFRLLFTVIIYSVHSFFLIFLIWGWGWTFLFLWRFEPEKIWKHS